MNPKPPRYAVVMLLPHCNMRCDFCITDGFMGTLTEEETAPLIRLFKREGFASVVLGGGEPLLWKPGLDAGASSDRRERPAVFELAKRLKAEGFETQLGTNGIALPAGFETKTEIDRYVLPLDGPDAETHERVRRYGSGHFALVRDRIETCFRSGKSLTLSTVVTRFNASKIKALYELIAGWHAARPFLHAWHLYQFVPSGRGGFRNADRLSVDPAVFEDAVRAVREAKPAFQVFKRPDLFHSKDVEFFWKEDDNLLRRLHTRVIRFQVRGRSGIP
ncbi:MAG: radical SAM protein [Spirochaetia bacterium]|nr:radical SAM protein [Spirochaetia bacterium]